MIATETLGVPVVEADNGTRAVVVVLQDIACLIRFEGATPVGYLRWDLDSGVVTTIEVPHSEHRRRGYASGMWEAARAISEERGWLGPLHEPDWEQVSDEGRAWRTAIGAGPDANAGDANADANGSSTTDER